jgi:Ca2+-binding EF-hand superfamily protein
MPGAAGAGAAAARRKQSRLGKERADWIQTQSIKLASDQVKIQQIFEKYDTNKSNALEFDQLKAFLSDTCAGTVDAVSSAVEHSKRKSEDKQKVIVTDEDVRFILLTCDKSKEGSVSKEEVLYALKVWTTYLDHQASIDQAFEKFDTDKSNSLDKEQLRACLQELNSGEPVSDADVDHVMQKGDILENGVLHRIELRVAVAAWYANAEVKQEKASISACCVLQ